MKTKKDKNYGWVILVLISGIILYIFYGCSEEKSNSPISPNPVPVKAQYELWLIQSHGTACNSIELNEIHEGRICAGEERYFKLGKDDYKLVLDNGGSHATMELKSSVEDTIWINW